MFKQVLHAVRVLDLAPGWSAYAGRLLGDLGAEVIKIEASSGDPLRGAPDFERLNANKYGCMLDVSTGDGRDVLRRLAATADVVIAPPGSIDADSLRDGRPGLIIVSLPGDATVEQAISAAAGVGVALWDRRRTGEGSTIEVTHSDSKKRRTIPAGAPLTETVSALVGDLQIESCPWHLSECATHIRLHAPALREHNEYIFGELLGS